MFIFTIIGIIAVLMFLIYFVDEKMPKTKSFVKNVVGKIVSKFKRK